MTIHGYTGVFELVPTEEVSVCPGNQLELTCSTSESMFLQWNLTIPHYEVTDTRVISASNMVGTVTPLQVPSVAFTFSITSASPLTSNLLINSTTGNLNDTKIICTERGSDLDRSSETNLHIINTTKGSSESDNIHFISLTRHMQFAQIIHILLWSEPFLNSLSCTVSLSFWNGMAPRVVCRTMQMWFLKVFQ